MKFKLLSILLMLVISCADISSEKKNAIIISEQKFENNKARELNNRAIKKLNNNKFDTSERLFFEALNLEPNNPTILGNIGLNYDLKEQPQKAIEYYERSLNASDSTYLIAGANLGLLYYQNKEFKKGITILNFVIDEASDSNLIFSAIINRAYNYLGMGDCENARSDLLRVKGSSSDNSDIDSEIIRLEKKIKNCVQQWP